MNDCGQRGVILMWKVTANVRRENWGQLFSPSGFFRGRLVPDFATFF